MTRARLCGCRFAGWPHMSDVCREARRLNLPVAVPRDKPKPRARFTKDHPRPRNLRGIVYAADVERET